MCPVHFPTCAAQSFRSTEITNFLSLFSQKRLAYPAKTIWKDISIAHVIIIIKSEVSTFPIVFIMFRGCVPEMLLHHILSLIVYTFRENREFVFIKIVQFMMSANSRIRFGSQIVFVCLYITPSHYHHCANFIWRYRTYKMPVRYNLSSVWVRLSIFSVIHYTIWRAVCFQFTHFLRDDWENNILCLIIIIKSEVWTISHCLG